MRHKKTVYKSINTWNSVKQNKSNRDKWFERFFLSLIFMFVSWWFGTDFAIINFSAHKKTNKVALNKMLLQQQWSSWVSIRIKRGWTTTQTQAYTHKYKDKHIQKQERSSERPNKWTNDQPNERRSERESESARERSIQQLHETIEGDYHCLLCEASIVTAISWRLLEIDCTDSDRFFSRTIMCIVMIMCGWIGNIVGGREKNRWTKRIRSGTGHIQIKSNLKPIKYH